MEKIEKYKEEIIISLIIVFANLAMYFDIYSREYFIGAQIINGLALAYFIYKMFNLKRENR